MQSGFFLNSTKNRILSQIYGNRFAKINYFSTRFGSSSAKSYNEPGGYFLGIKPPGPGYKRRRLEFEWFMLGVFFPVLAGWHIVAGWYAPEPELQAWARQEALKRLDHLEEEEE